MKHTGFILLVCCVCVVMHIEVGAQAGTSAKKNEIGPFNQVDANGKRTGKWWITYNARMDEGAYSEFGHYDRGRKYGQWYKIDDNENLMSIETYNNDVLDGEVKYFDRGQLSCIGHYRGLNPKYEYDTIVITDPVTGAETLRAIPSDRGTMRHGMWRYYDPETGRLVKEEEYQVDDLIYEKEFLLTKDDSLYYDKRILNLPHNKGKMRD